jgi:hypothetical protein
VRNEAQTLPLCKFSNKETCHIYFETGFHLEILTAGVNGPLLTLYDCPCMKGIQLATVKVTKVAMVIRGYLSTCWNMSMP